MSRCMHCGGDDHGTNQCPDMPPSVIPTDAQAVGVRSAAIEECAKLMQRWSDEAAEVKNSDRCTLQANVCRNAAVAIRNLASQPSPAATVETCSNCNGTKRATYYSEQASAHEERDCHVCRPQCSAGNGAVTRDDIAKILAPHAYDVVQIHGRVNASRFSVQELDLAFEHADSILALSRPQEK